MQMHIPTPMHIGQTQANCDDETCQVCLGDELGAGDEAAAEVFGFGLDAVES